MNVRPETAGAAVEWVLPWGPTMRGERWGAGPDRVLLLHEPGTDIDAWRGLPRTLSRVLPVEAVTFDLPGHGLSDAPWELARLPEIIRALTEHDSARRTCLVAAGATASAALGQAGELQLTGLVGLAPVEPFQPRETIRRSPMVPKLLIAGTLAGHDLDVARRLSATHGGWSMVTAVPVDARGTGLLATPWSIRVREEIYGFLRDCLQKSRVHPGRAPLPSGASR